VKREAGRFFAPVLAVGLVLLAWGILAAALDNPALPGPFPSLRALVQVSPSLWPHFLTSLYRVAASLLIGLVAAAPLGLVLGRHRLLDILLTPAAYLIYPVPKIAFLPVVFLLLGIGDAARVLLITMIVFFQILVTTRDAARSIPYHSVLSVVSLGAGPMAVYRHVIIPACLPKILTALRVSLGSAVSVLFFSETVAGTSGLGYFILNAMYRAEYAQMLAGIIAMSLLGLLLYGLIEWLERRWCAWQFVT
jgi:NitT/TauT family transport system permease protein